MAFLSREYEEAIAALAERNVFVGTSSWKYPGWIGQLYDEQRYLWRGKVSNSRFERDCLEEYARVFKTVCVDAGYYRFPTEETLPKLVAQVPEDFRFSFKVTDEITTKRFSKLPRYGPRAGTENPNFLNADLFQSLFLAPIEPCRANVGLLMFEFSHFYPGTFERGRDFVDRLDRFFEKLPSGWQYGVEIRNQSFLREEYFAMLKSHGVTHVYNNWERMPAVEEQLEMEGSATADFFGARFLLTPGRKYAEAVESFSPYNETRRVDDSARKAGSRLMKREVGKRSFLYVNNRLEGNSLETIRAMMGLAGG
ncbi:MAG: hypothetical protein ACI9UA_000139 [Pseudoalteromonas tetraodonis]